MNIKGKLKPLGILALFLAAPLSAQSAQAELLTLEAALDRVETMNLRIMIQQENVRQAVENIYRSRAGLLPNVSLEAAQSRSKTSTLGSGFGTGGSVGPYNRFDAFLQARVPLIDANAYAEYKLAQIDKEIADLNYDGLRQELMELVSTAYFTHMRNLERLNVIEANVERDRVLFELAQRQLEGGIATQIDVTRSEVQLATDDLDRERQETLIMQSESDLKTILNLDPDYPVEVWSFAELENKDVEKIIPDELNISILNKRPDYRQATRELERNQVARKAADWERLPTLNLVGEYGYVAEDAFDDDGDERWAIGLNVSLPIFEGFRIRSNKNTAQSAIRQKEYEIRDIERQFMSDIRVAIRNVRSLQRQIGLVQKTVELREAELELARERFEQGVTDNSDVVTAQAAIATANDDYIRAIYEYNLARIELARVQGNVRLILKDEATPSQVSAQPEPESVDGF